MSLRNKRKNVEENQSCESQSKRQKHQDGDSRLFSGLNFFIIDAGIGKTRAGMFKKQLSTHGGTIVNQISENIEVTILVDETVKVKRICEILGISEKPNIFELKVVKLSWVTACLKNKRMLDSSDYLIDFVIVNKSCSENDNMPEVNVNASTSTDVAVIHKNEEKKLPKIGGIWKAHKKKNPLTDEQCGAKSDSDYVASDEEEALELPGQSDMLPKKPKFPGHWVCALSSANKQDNFNKHITDKLKELANVYESTNDKWRAMSYKKAIGTLQKHPKPISSFEEAKALPGVGEKLAEKIWEIVESGELRKLDELSNQEEIQALKLFTGVWGAGAVTARTWVQAGFRTLEDIRTKAQLTRHQQIGLNYYDDLIERMPRSEAAEIEEKVKEAAYKINPNLVCMACGSYRRGKATCGDVDVLVTHPDGKSHKGVFNKLLSSLHDSGFLTDDLVKQEENGNQCKYLGVCKLPGENTKHRRLDIIVVPYDEYACAIMYFTGSAYFNRSMRLLAKKMNMSLTEHSLNKDVVRHNSEKINRGVPIPTWTEEDVFRHLNLKYRPPEERDH